MKWFKSLKEKEIFFRYWNPWKVVQEVYKSIPSEEWSVLESVGEFSSIAWLVTNLDKNLALTQKTLPKAKEVVEFVIEQVKEARDSEILTEEDMEGYCIFIKYCLFHERN